MNILTDGGSSDVFFISDKSPTNIATLYGYQNEITLTPAIDGAFETMLYREGVGVLNYLNITAKHSYEIWSDGSLVIKQDGTDVTYTGMKVINRAVANSIPYVPYKNSIELKVKSTNGVNEACIAHHIMTG